MTRGGKRVLRLMRDGRWHDSAEIEQACQVTAHSRLAELRENECELDKRHNPGATGRHMYSYRLVHCPAALLEQLDSSGSRSPGFESSCSSDVVLDESLRGTESTVAESADAPGSAAVGVEDDEPLALFGEESFAEPGPIRAGTGSADDFDREYARSGGS